MTIARRRDAWDRTAGLMALVASALGGKSVAPEQFNPLRSSDPRKQEITSDRAAGLLGAPEKGYTAAEIERMAREAKAKRERKTGGAA